MLNNNLKLNDSFLVTVEIITADAIIVSANVNSVIFRGTLIRCNKNSQCLFTKISNKQSSFSSNRLDLKNLKRQIKFKTFKSSYNLRRTNNKIIKAKQNINKSESSDPKSIIFNKKPLSIKLKKDNGVYINTSNTSIFKNNREHEIDLSHNIDYIKKNDLTIKKETNNIIKIVKTKVESNKYHYSIINKFNDDSNIFDECVHNHSQSKILKLCITPIPDALLPRSDDTCSMSVNDNFCQTKIYNSESSGNINENKLQLIPLKNHGKNDINNDLTLNHNEANIITPEMTNKNEIIDSPQKVNEIKSLGFTKLKFVKNGSKPNSYVIKSNEKPHKPTTIMKRYNCKKFQVGDIVWAKLSGYSIWPAKVIDLHDGNDNATVMWLGDDYRTSQLLRWKLWDFGAHFHEKFNKKGKGNYMNAVHQAQAEYSKLDFTDCNNSWFFDISSESSTLESVNIDDVSCELDHMSSQDLQVQNIYLPLPEEEFELMRSNSKSRMSDFLSFDSPGSQEMVEKIQHDYSHNIHNDVSSISVPFSAKFQLNPNDFNYNFI